MSGPIPQLKRAVKSSRTLAIGARIAAERGRDVRRMTGRKENEMGATHWALSLEQSLDYIDTVFDEYLRYGGYSVADLDGKRVLELGPGDNFAVGLRFLAAGVAEFVATDRFIPYRDPARQRLIYEGVIDRLPDGAGKDRVAPVLAGGGDVERNLEAVGLRKLDETPIEDAVDILGSGYDLIISRAVLEHVGDLPAAFKAMDELLAPGGRMMHKVDLRDHNLFGGGLNPLTFLTVSDRTYRWMGEDSAGLPNRVRIGWYQEEMERLGYDATFYVAGVFGIEDEFTDFVPIDELEIDAESDRLVAAARGSLLPRYTPMDTAELAICDFMLVADKPAG